MPYPLYLANGQTPEDPETLKVWRGEKIRLRLMNPAGDTVFRVAVAGHRLTVTHADGLPVEPVEVETMRLDMGKRYDALLGNTDNPGVWQIAAVPEDKDGLGRVLLRYEEGGESSAPPAGHKPRELEGRLLAYEDLEASSGESFP